MKNRRKAVQPFEIKKRKIDIFRNYEANGFEKNQRKFENFSTLISKKSKLRNAPNIPQPFTSTASSLIVGMKTTVTQESISENLKNLRLRAAATNSLAFSF